MYGFLIYITWVCNQSSLSSVFLNQSTTKRTSNFCPTAVWVFFGWTGKPPSSLWRRAFWPERFLVRSSQVFGTRFSEIAPRPGFLSGPSACRWQRQEHPGSSVWCQVAIFLPHSPWTRDAPRRSTLKTRPCLRTDVISNPQSQSER